MIELGKKQKLTIIKRVDFGVYLAEDRDAQERVLLPGKQVPPESRVGDEMEVFVYRDSKDRLISTTQTPLVTLGQVALLSVAQVGKIGAFLSWGLEKDLLLPFREQTCRVRPGDQVLAALYVDKSSRLCSTMKVYHYLRTDAPYEKDDLVKGRIYEISDNFGAFVAVDNLYSALIPKREMYGRIELGTDVSARVAQVREDGRLSLSVREKAYLQMDKDAEELLAIIDSYAGVLPFNDKASPEIIKRETNMSKNEFKRAVGRLLKEGKIEIGEKVIRRR